MDKTIIPAQQTPIAQITNVKNTTISSYIDTHQVFHCLVDNIIMQSCKIIYTLFNINK